MYVDRAKKGKGEISQPITFEALHGTTRDDLDGLETAGLELSVQVLFPNVFVEEAIFNVCELIGINRRRFQD